MLYNLYLNSLYFVLCNVLKSWGLDRRGVEPTSAGSRRSDCATTALPDPADWSVKADTTYCIVLIFTTTTSFNTIHLLLFFVAYSEKLVEQKIANEKLSELQFEEYIMLCSLGMINKIKI